MTNEAIASLAELNAKFLPEGATLDAETILNLAAEHEIRLGSSDISMTCSEYSTFDPNEPSVAKVIDYRGEKVACFVRNGRHMICLPQVYELFLKNMVGGLHTVYTKLKRLDIMPVICNVEQVRSLRGLGAIQPGVNRCKLIDSADFDRLYDDCTNTCTRPGRPAKRNPPEEWSQAIKKERSEAQTDLYTSAMSMSSPFFGQLMPNFGAQQLLMQHMLALAAAQQQQQPMTIEPENRPDSSIGDDSSASAGGSRTESTPLNLTKSIEDTESLDSRKVETSMSPSHSNSDRDGLSISNGSNNSPSSENSSNAFSKLSGLVDMATDHFKQQREILNRERDELLRMRHDETLLRHKLEMERRRANTYFRRYCKARQDALSYKEQLLDMRDHVQPQSDPPMDTNAKTC